VTRSADGCDADMPPGVTTRRAVTDDAADAIFGVAPAAPPAINAPATLTPAGTVAAPCINTTITGLYRNRCVARVCCKSARDWMTAATQQRHTHRCVWSLPSGHMTAVVFQPLQCLLLLLIVDNGSDISSVLSQHGADWCRGLLLFNYCNTTKNTDISNDKVSTSDVR